MYIYQNPSYRIGHPFIGHQQPEDSFGGVTGNWFPATRCHYTSAWTLMSSCQCPEKDPPLVMFDPGPWQLIADDPGHSPPDASQPRVSREGVGDTEHYHTGT